MEKIFLQIKDNWIILCFIVALIVSWTNANSRLVNAESEIEELHRVVAQINQINISLAEIKTDISYIKRSLYSD